MVKKKVYLCIQLTAFTLILSFLLRLGSAYFGEKYLSL